MKYLMLFILFVSSSGLLYAQTSAGKAAKLESQLLEVAKHYIDFIDLTDHNRSNPKCEPFIRDYADSLASLFVDPVDQVQVINIYSDAFLNYYSTTNQKQKRPKDSDVYITFSNYFSTARDNNPTYAAFSYIDKSNFIISPIKSEKKVKGNKYESVIRFSYQQNVCKGDNSFDIKSLTVRLTCVYESDSNGNEYSYPKIEKVELDELASQWRYDFFVAPHIGYSSGKYLMEQERILNFHQRNLGNLEFGANIQIKRPSFITPAFSSTVLIGIGYRQINFEHELPSLNLEVTDEDSPITPFNPGIITKYKKEIHLNDVAEETQLKMITVPVGMGFDIRLGNLDSKRLLYFNPTITLGFPLAYKSSYTSGTVDYIGHFNIAGPSQPFSITVDDFMIDDKRSFGYDYSAKSALQEYPLKKINIAAEVEVGYKYKVNPSTTLNFGCFMSYGLLNNFSEAIVSQSQITSWNGELLSYPYYSNPTRNLLFGFRLSVQRFAFQLKNKNRSIISQNSIN